MGPARLPGLFTQETLWWWAWAAQRMVLGFVLGGEGPPMHRGFVGATMMDSVYGIA